MAGYQQITPSSFASTAQSKTPVLVEHDHRHVDFESLLERESLLAADNAPNFVAIAAQPLALLWPRTTRGNRDHVPDFFVELANGDGRLIDVRSPERS